MLIHGNVRPFECEYCGKKFRLKHHLINHLKLHMPKQNNPTMDCTYTDTDMVGESGWSQDFFQTNWSNDEENENEPLPVDEKMNPAEEAICSFDCVNCKQTFNDLVSLDRHVAIHHASVTKTYSCKECGKTFSQMGSLTSHKLIHEDVRKWHCNHCDKKFRHKHHLRNHLKLHGASDNDSTLNDNNYFI